MQIKTIVGKVDELVYTKTVKVTTAGNTIKVQSMSRQNTRQTVEKLSKDEYIVTSTGEVRLAEHSENRGQNVNGLIKTISRLRDLLNANVTEPKNMLWVTLTYAENMTDRERLYHDSKNFHKRLNRYCLRQEIPVPKYFDVVEPQERGAWHIHEILMWEREAPFIPNCKLEELWRNGFVWIKKVDEHCDNIGAYLTPYLTDLELNDDTAHEISDSSDESIVEREIYQDGEKKSKKFIKGGRLYMYPPGMNLFRHSRGIKEPITEEMTYFQAKEKVSGATKTFEKSVLLTGEMYNSIIYTEYYNTKR